MCSQSAHNKNVNTEHFAACTRVHSDPNLKSENWTHFPWFLNSHFVSVFLTSTGSLICKSFNFNSLLILCVFFLLWRTLQSNSAPTPTSRHEGKKEILTPALTAQNETERARNFDVITPLCCQYWQTVFVHRQIQPLLIKQKQLHEL